MESKKNTAVGPVCLPEGVRSAGVSSKIGLCAVVVGAVAISGCVGSQGALNLSSAQVNEPIQRPVQAVLAGDPNATVTPADNARIGEQQIYAGIAVPSPSPKVVNAAAQPAPPKPPEPTTELAAVAETQNSSAANTVIEQTIQTKQSQTAEQPVSAAPSGSQTASNENAVASQDAFTPKEVEVSSVTPETAQAPDKPNFFQRLFGNQQAKAAAPAALEEPSDAQADEPAQRARKRTINPSRFSDRGDRGVRVASAHYTGRIKKVNESARKSILLSRTRAAQSRDFSDALPGVKSNNDLFGIRDSNGSGNTQVAAVGSLGRLSPNGLRVQHAKVQVQCLKPEVLRLLKMVERRYGSKPIITSGYRSPRANRRAGGARNSQHIYCKAVDIQVEGVSKWELAKYLRTLPGRGGVGTYCRTKSVHVDVGSKRDWHHPCRRSKVRKRKKA